MKCDESRPSCRNCTTIERRCSYLDWQSRRPGSHLARPESSLPSSPELHQPCAAGLVPSGPADDTHAVFTMLHLELLHHFELEMCHGLSLPAHEAMHFSKVSIQCALTTPYLMDQILAIAAAHRSTVCVADRQAYYRRQAAELQTRGLSRLNREGLDRPTGETNNSLPMFLYSSFLAIHVMFDSLRHRELEALLDAFVTYLSAQRAVRTFAGLSWTEIRPLVEYIVGRDYECFRQTHRRAAAASSEDCECAPLAALVQRSSLHEADRATCSVVVDELQWTFDLSKAASDPRSRVHFIGAWATHLPVEFLGLIKDRTPEALVILAYCAVLLHRSRRYWIFDGAGQFLVWSISKHLGEPWADVLTWPNEQIKANF